MNGLLWPGRVALMFRQKPYMSEQLAKQCLGFNRHKFTVYGVLTGAESYANRSAVMFVCDAFGPIRVALTPLLKRIIIE